MFELSKCDHTIYNKLYNKLNRYDQYNKLYNLNRYDHTTANYVYAGGQKGKGIGKVIALFLIIEVIALFLIKSRGIAISKKDVLVLAGVGTTIGVLLYGVGRLLK